MHVETKAGPAHHDKDMRDGTLSAVKERPLRSVTLVTFRKESPCHAFNI